MTGVATFYHFFSFKPKGEHRVVICMGTACFVRGGGRLAALGGGARRGAFERGRIEP